MQQTGDTRRSRDASISKLLSAARDGRLLESLRGALTRIARAENLLRLAAGRDADAMNASKSSSVRITIKAGIERNGELRSAMS